MKAISFLGIGDYKETSYCYGERSHTTRFFAAALPAFFDDLEQVLLFVTPTVNRHDNFAQVSQSLGDLLQPVPIPEGRSEQELWQIFDALTGAVDEGETVVFDITNSYRSLPFLVFLAAAYLRSARRVQVAGVLYGAWEARDSDNRSPVFDLSPFVALLDWLTATNQFVHTGDARYLAHLLRQAGQVEQASALKTAGEKLEGFSLAMMLCRPLEVMEQAGTLGRVLDRAVNQLTPGTRPFSLLSDRIQESYAGRALIDPTTEVVSSLNQQLDLIGWYLEHNQVIQAVTLAREWVVTAVGWRLGRGFLLPVGDRGDVEWALSGAARVGQERQGRQAAVDELSPTGRAIWNWPERDDLRKLWNQLSSVRNDLDHAGMSAGRRKAARLAREAQDEIWQELQKLAVAWNLKREAPPP